MYEREEEERMVVIRIKIKMVFKTHHIQIQLNIYNHCVVKESISYQEKISHFPFKE